MALPPQDSAQFEREVDEEYRRQQASDFGKKYGIWIGVALVLFLGAIGGWLYWQDRQQKQAEADTEELAGIIADVSQEENPENVRERLQAVAADSDGAAAASARMIEAAYALQEGDRGAAIEIYKALAQDEAMPEPYRGAALIRWTYLDFDQVEPDVVVARLQGLAQPGEPYFASAAELTALALLKQGQDDEGAQLFKAIAEDRDAPRTLRSRAVQIAGTYGVDASAALADIEAQE
ncbi:tetratricopeptide repeat protein [Sphingomicrobium sp. XHP0235]|uniref:tetratricopeptide repeat protein n=1 Tax=Sphingomicrobium aquimarinum TaxID=3133971 RepID=UPI0031FE969F